MVQSITKAQIAKIWATAHERGLDRDALYELVPRGSISHLTRHEASNLIGYLERMGAGGENGAIPAWRPNEATPEQKRLIARLFRELGWADQPHRVRGFLRKFAGVEDAADLRDRKRAIALIEALKAMIQRRRAKRAARN